MRAIKLVSRFRRLPAPQRWFLTVASLALLCVLSDATSTNATEPATIGPSKVSIDRTAGKWRLTRNGRPYYILGAGGLGPLKDLAAAGANSNRTWGVDEQTRAHLDEAHRHGLSVTVGIWLEHERLKKIKYSNEEQVEAQAQLVLSHVRRLKDHPAVLAWGIGNEMEADGSNVLIWKHIEDLARRVKEIDPNHPTMTVIAELGESKIQSIHEHCPSIDIIGINAYGGAKSVPVRYREKGGTKPYVVTEFGPKGTWEVDKNSFGAINEATAQEKSIVYRDAFNSFQSDQEFCLGSYAFLWGSKQEGTANWFGMLLPDGKRLGTADMMSELWSGKSPKNQCPIIESLTLKGHNQVTPGGRVRLKLKVSDAERDELKVRWQLFSEADAYITNGDFQKSPEQIKGAVISQNSTGANIALPVQEGIYRIYVYVEDDVHRNAASHNVPIFVTKTPTPPIAPTPQPAGTRLPLVVYDEANQAQPNYVPSGLMGSTEAVSIDANCAVMPKVGKHCMRLSYQKCEDWAGVVWQHPPNDWGDLPGGFDLSKAKKLSFWARGKSGGEEVKFGYGLLGKDKKFPDSASNEISVKLTTDWVEYSILCQGDLSRIKSGFYWSLAGQGEPVEFFVDRVRYR